MVTESPSYTVESRDGDVEIRKYKDYLLAQVDVKVDYDEAMGIGFRTLAHYIFGGNRRRSDIPMATPVSEEIISGHQKIPMTTPVMEELLTEPEKIHMATPVVQEALKGPEQIPRGMPVTEEKTDELVYRISFTMPSQYTLETLPEPEDKSIMFREVKDQRAAVLRFSGRVRESLEQEKIEELKFWLARHGIEPRSNFVVAQYNHPAIPGFLRRNEIIVTI